MKQILIVDDNKRILSLLSDCFSLYMEDWQVITAENGRKAIGILGSTTVDFLLTDLEMPAGDGFGLLAHVREYHPSLPYLVMTGKPDLEMDSRLRGFGVTEVVSKPFDFRILLEKIADNLNRPALEI